GALALAAVQAEEAFSRVETALKRTGNASGATLADINNAAKALNATTTLSQRGALDTLGILIGRGNLTGAQAARVDRALPGFAQATGLNEDKAAAELEKLLSDPAKGAEELNAQFKLLDTATLRQIKSLEDAGRYTEAQDVLIGSINGRFTE